MASQRTLYSDPSQPTKTPSAISENESCSLLSHALYPSSASQDTLVEAAEQPKPSVMTALPLAQLFCLCVCRLADPIMFTQILPYVNEMMTDLHVTKDPSRIGFYSGLVESSFAVAQLLSIYHWARLSDVVGRRPVIFLGVIGMATGSLFFGLSKTLAGVLLSRSISGLFSGNIAAIHSALGELTDASNQAVAFPIYGLTWPLGAIIGPLIGGTFSNPAMIFPTFFTNKFWHTYPYFLPGLISSIIAISGVFFGYFFLEETLPSKRRKLEKNRMDDDQYDDDKNIDQPPNMRSLLALPAIRALCFSGAALSFTSTAFDILFVLFCYSPIESGGLAFSASEIGAALAMSGIISVLLQIFVTPILLARCNHARLYHATMGFWPYCFAFLPLVNVFARLGFTSMEVEGPLDLSMADIRIRALVWCLIAALLAVSKLACLSYAVSMILVKSHAPSSVALGASNGLVQFSMCLTRAFTPAFASAVFAFSLDYNIIGGHFWAIVMVALSVLGTMTTSSIEVGDAAVDSTAVAVME